jgi:cephalosporin hydroxylase
MFSDKRFGDLEKNKYAKIALEANELYHYMWQEDEIADALKFLDENLSKKTNGFIEIGSAMGGSFHCWGNIIKDGIKISVDLPLVDTGTTWPEFVKSKAETFSGLNSDGINYRLKIWNEHLTDVVQILGDSTQIEIVNKVKEVLNGKQVDFLFIDGDHSYQAIESDFLKYKDFVRKGGYIGFHDIIGHYGQYWAELVLANPDLCTEITSNYLPKILKEANQSDIRGGGPNRNGDGVYGAGIGMFKVI